jgi:glycosyltransferase involved in cell wall biosynthesis
VEVRQLDLGHRADVSAAPRPLLTVVVPVYNGGQEVVENVEVIRRAVADGLPGEEVEFVVVSDGSIDDTAEHLLEARAETGIRVIHYDRNLGKGYAVKSGAMAARGEWVALVDADLDLDPASIPEYVELARLERLDFAIGSKRHEASVVHYPLSRHVASWCYQQLNRVLFGLEVRDTQVGLKVFSRDVVREVMPLLLVKQFAFDLELLAVATALGRGRIRELPVRLEYRFTGSALGSAAVVRALWDTAAVFYRLRILRTYQRKRRLLGSAQMLPPEALPLVSLIGDSETARLLDYPRLEVLGERHRAEAARAATGDLLAVLALGARPAGNWVTAAVPYLLDQDAAAVVCPTLVPHQVPLRHRLAAAVLESRVGSGSRRIRYLPGNVRTVPDHAAESIIVRREAYVEALASGVPGDRLVAWLAERGKRTIYTPDTSVSAAPPPLVRPHLAETIAYARTRGAVARASHGASLSASTAVSVGPAAGALGGGLLLVVGGRAGRTGVVLMGAYAAALAVSGVHAAIRFRSLTVGLLQPLAAIATHAAYFCGFLRGLAGSPVSAKRLTARPPARDS